MRLETERLILRPWQEKDMDYLILGLNNINVSKWLAYVPCPYTNDDAKKWINYCMTLNCEEPSSYEWAIELKKENIVIGGMSLDKINKLHGTAGGGIWINENYHGYGYGTEAFGKRIEFAFEVLNLRRLENGFFVGNDSSFKMQKRFGYQLEGLKRKVYKLNYSDEYIDEHITGLLKEEWQRY